MRPALVAAVALLLPGSLAAQRAVPEVRPVASTSHAPSVTAEEAVAQMRAALRQLVTQEERYWMDHGTYTTDVAALGLYPPITKDGVWAQVIFAGGRGWTGMATHPAARGRSCVVYVGAPDELPRLPTTRAQKTTPDREGLPACDQP
jgi:hypothetical protein